MTEKTAHPDSARGEIVGTLPVQHPNRSRDLLLGLATLATIGCAGFWIFRPAPPTLDQAVRLVKEGSIEPASAVVLRYLADRPDEIAGYQFLSNLLDRDPPAPNPAHVLSGLQKVAPRNRATQSLHALNRGKAWYRLARYDAAEAAWLEALRIDPAVPEAVWALLSLYYVQSRERDARRLALEQYRFEPDGRDRVLLLLQLIRADAQPPAPAAIALSLARIEAENPKDLHSMIALGLALVDDSRSEEGLAVLERQVARRPGNLDAIEGFLLGLNLAGETERLASFLEKLPPPTARSDRLAWFQGRAAESRRDWQAAAIAYERAARSELPGTKALREVLHRWQQALRLAGRSKEANAVIARFKRLEAAEIAIRALYDEADRASGSLGVAPHARLYRSIAKALIDLNRFAEARLWLRLAVRDDPGDSVAAEALRRLESQPKSD